MRALRRVWYRTSSGARTAAEVVSVDLTHPPPSFCVRLEGAQSTRETEADRLSPWDAPAAPLAAPASPAEPAAPAGEIGEHCLLCGTVQASLCIRFGVCNQKQRQLRHETHAGAAATPAASEAPGASDQERALTEEAPAADAPGAELLAQQSAPEPTKEVKVAGTQKEPDRCAYSPPGFV